MATTGIRLLYPQNVDRGMLKAAERAVTRFRAFGIMTDSMAASREASKGVKSGEALRTFVMAQTEASLGGNAFLHPTIHDVVRSVFSLPRIIGVGLSHARFFNEDGGKREFIFGNARIGIGLILSLAKIQEVPQELQEKAVERTLVHLIGHVLRSTDHCPDTKCVLQAHGPFDDIIQKLVLPPGLDICRPCGSDIMDNVRGIEAY